MLSFARRRITFANVAMTVALVLAMSGGTFAAGKFLITSTKQISPKVLKSLQGKAGPAGVAGAQGPAGPAGAAGPQGPAGVAGAKGETGAEGKEGKAGKDGKAGLTGSPWTAGGTLPSGSTETGVWAFGPLKSPGGLNFDVVSVASFPIPLAAPLGEGHAHFINENGMEINIEEEEVAPTQCGSGITPGITAQESAAHPQAKPGNLCIYAVRLNDVEAGSYSIRDPALGGTATAGRNGATALFRAKVGEQEGEGTWAVTAE